MADNHVLTTQERIALAKHIFDECEQPLSELYSRWQDEQEYESPDDYKKYAQELLKKYGATLTRFTMRPFRIYYTLSDVAYVIKVTRTTYAYERVV